MNGHQTLLTLLTRVANHIARGETAQAYALITPAGRLQMFETLEEGWERMLEPNSTENAGLDALPDEFMFDDMTLWPTREDHDIGWGYLPLVNQDINEAICGIATLTAEGPRLRMVELGRP